MNREESMAIVAKLRGDAAMVLGPGANCGLLYVQADTPATIYNMEMAYATPVALGIALACPSRKVLAVEGEGSFFAGSAILSTIWRLKPANLTVLVTDNGVWGTGDGREPSATAFGTDLAALALANGWDAERVHAVDAPDVLETGLAAAMAGGGPHFFACMTDPALDRYLVSSAHRPRPMRHLLDCAVLMRRDLTPHG